MDHVLRIANVAFWLTWAARLSSVAMAGLFMAFLFGEEAAPNLFKEPLSVQLIFLGWGILFVGYAVAWWRQAIGGTIVVAAIAFMYLVEYGLVGRWLGPAFLLWAVPGCLFIAAATLAER